MSMSLACPFSDAMIAGMCVIQMDDQLLCPDGAASGVQAGHSRRLSLDWPVISALRTGRAREAEAIQGVRKSAGRQPSCQRGMFMLTRPRGITLRERSCCPPISIGMAQCDVLD